MAGTRLRDYFINPFKTFGGTNPFSMGATKEEEDLKRLRDYKEGNVDLKKRDTKSPEYITINNELLAVQRDAQIAAFQGAQEGATQSYTGEIGEPFSMAGYKSTAMFPEKGAARSDPGRLQASPVGYDEEEWWRETPSIFNMKPYSW